MIGKRAGANSSVKHGKATGPPYHFATPPGARGDATISLMTNTPSTSWDTRTGLAGYAWQAANPRAVLLLQHGFAEYAGRYVAGYSRFIPHLLDLGVSVYAIDLPGHGHSPGRRGLTDVDHAVAAHLAARRKVAGESLPVFLFGHSLGGLVTATSVLRDPANVAGVILSSPPLYVKSNGLTRIFGRLVTRSFPTLPLIRLHPSGISRDPQQVRAFIDDPLVHHGRMPARLAASILFGSQDNWPRYRQWKLPTLVMHGSADTFTAVDGSRRFHATIASPDKTLHEVEGGYHELLNDTDAAETLRVVMTWLEDRLPRRRPSPSR